MTQYTVTEVAAIMNISTNTLIKEVEDYESTMLFDISMVSNMVVPIGTVNVNNKQYYFGYECEPYCKDENRFFNHIVLSEHCTNTEWHMNDSPQEQQMVMALHIDHDFQQRYGKYIIWSH